MPVEAFSRHVDARCPCRDGNGMSCSVSLPPPQLSPYPSHDLKDIDDGVFDFLYYDYDDWLLDTIVGIGFIVMLVVVILLRVL